MIVTVKGQNVIIDSDVARIYGVETREVNQAMKPRPEGVSVKMQHGLAPGMLRLW